MPCERLEPGTAEWQAFIANHRQRYEFAVDQLSRRGARRILDAATGVGYGAEHLAAALLGADIIAVDRDSHALDVARAQFAHPRVDYRRDDCEALTTLDDIASLDAVVSFETIEHLSAPDRFLRRVAMLLAPGGTLIASTPNRVVSEAERGAWEYHEREYSASEFRELLEAAGFGHVEIFGQKLTPIGMLRRSVRGEINRLRFNPLARLGFWIQRRLRGLEMPPALPECPEDFQIVPYASAAAVEGEGTSGPFVLIAMAERPTPT